ncbi:MAG: YhjD/YihY/BrkB family envelope integrity protein [Spirochaetota bacterium]
MKEEMSFLERTLVLPEEQTWKRKFIVMARIVLVSISRFLSDECLIKASGIAYTAIISLVPTLTVGLALVTLTSGFDSKKEQLFDTINTYLLKYKIPLDISPYFKILDDLVNSATQIGAIGFIVLIFSATAVLRTFETAFNHIWRVTTARSFFSKIIFYFFLMSIGPLLLIVVTGYAMKFSDAVRVSHFQSIHRSQDGFVWVTGERGILSNLSATVGKIFNLRDAKVDFENMNCFSTIGEKQPACDLPNLERENYIRTQDREKRMLSVSENGVLLYSDNKGIQWNLDYYPNLEIKDFAFLDKYTVFLLRKDGKILRHSLGIQAKELTLPDSQSLEIRKIFFADEKVGMVLDRNGKLLLTQDGGDSFLEKKVVGIRGKNITKNYELNDFLYISENEYIVAGNKGNIFHTLDAGNTWNMELSHKTFSYEKIWQVKMQGQKVLLVLNALGQLLYSLDMGKRWKVSYVDKVGKLADLIPVFPNGQKALKSSQILSSGQFLAVGEFKLLLVGFLKQGRLFWKPVSGGSSVFSLYSFLRILFPLTAIWLFFVFLYSLIPNIRVSFRAVSIGSAVTGVILLLFLASFGIYVRSFSATTMIVYQALAAIPIFLLSVYSFCIIILFGAELTATLHYKERYLLPVNPFAKNERELDHFFYKVIKFLVKVYRSQKDKRVLPSEKVMSEYLATSDSELNLITELLVSNNLLLIGQNGEYAPVLPADYISLHDIFRKVFSKSFRVPKSESDKELQSKLQACLQDTDILVKKHLQQIKLSQLLS